MNANNHNLSLKGILARFTPQVATWFQDVFAQPTPVQLAAWEAISAGENALVVAPTGSGKTLAAFLWALNSLVDAPGQTHIPVVNNTVATFTPAGKRHGKDGGAGVKILYISPLKALGVDVERNLRAPLVGINRTAQALGLDSCDITVGVRSGDTPAAQRAAQVRRPPDILITTPESAYLMLTSKAAGILSTVHTVIIDEIHAMAGTKRGVHLALTLERLERLVTRSDNATSTTSAQHNCEGAGFSAHRKLQRIGLSATVRPLETVAQFLGGAHPVQIINPEAHKQWDLQVRVPVADMSDLSAPELGSTIGEFTFDDPHGLATPLPIDSDDNNGDDNDDLLALADRAFPTSATHQQLLDPRRDTDAAQGSIWPHIEQRLYEDIMAHRSTLIFVNSRRSAERLTARLNELHTLHIDPGSLDTPAQRAIPAQMMAQSDSVVDAAHVIARAHHGSVSKDERAMTERLLKEGNLRAVVATSSLELGIDMGSVELVVQIESPPSVASGLQRVGRAGHVVGATSHGVFYPKHRADLLQSAVTVQRMRQGLIEELKVPRNALDVLVQQTIAAVSVEDIDVEEWYATVTRAYPYRTLAREVFDSVIDLASGVYPSTDFAELKPRIIFDRITGMMKARPGAQRVAVTSGGTIPDRGMFGVYVLGGEAGARRVGELDEEMVYESRVGDVFTLGASSWRIEEINRDQVLVSPAPGHAGRLPFWLGDQMGRPAELGKAVGAFRRAVAADASVAGQVDRLDEFARANVVRFVAEQVEATGIVPDEKTLVLERFRDEVGDWRVVLHTPFGRGVNAAWALAVGAGISQEWGIDAQPVSSDDGIVLRLPEQDRDPDASLFLLDPDVIEDVVTQQVGNSALFASRFRECAARGLLLPRRNPGKRAPLWQQRQKAAQLLDVARKYPSFPIILEAVRECLQDVYDLGSLKELLEDLRARRVRIVEVTTQQPSPFASSILFHYTGAFIYEGDSPLAEKRAAALALDPSLLAKLLGTVELRDLLDPEIIAEVDAQLRRVSPDRLARTPEELVDVLRVLGPVADVDAHVLFDVDMDALVSKVLAGRVMRVRINGVEHCALTQDAALLRDGLGVPVPPGVPAQVDTIADALEQLVGRWVRSRGPFVLGDVQKAFGLSASVAHTVVGVLMNRKAVVEGHYRSGVDEPEYVASEVLKILRSRSLAKARAQTQPVSQSAFARFLCSWQQVAEVGGQCELYGIDGLYAVLEQLAGVALPASAWEEWVLPSRVRHYNPADLDELTHNGEIVVVGRGQAGPGDPWVMLLPAELASDIVTVDKDDEAGLTSLQRQVLDFVRQGGSYLYPQIKQAVGAEDLGLVTGHASDSELGAAVWGLFELSLLCPDSFAPLRARLAGGATTAHKARRTPNRSRVTSRGATRFRTGASLGRTNPTPPDMLGRWGMVISAQSTATSRAYTVGENLLERYGVVTRGSVQTENIVGGFQLAYKVLSQFEESGKAMRGLFVEGLGAAQFSTPAVVDRLRGHDDSIDGLGWPSGAKTPSVYVLAAADPANPYGAAVPWPVKGPTRAAGALVVLIDGLLAAHVTRGGKHLTLVDTPQPALDMIVSALSATLKTRLVVEKINGSAALNSPLLDQLRQAGASISPKGIIIAPRSQSSTPATTRSRGRSLSDAVEEITADDHPHSSYSPERFPQRRSPFYRR